jgi:hypothetical protein
MSTARSANRNCSAEIDVAFLNKPRGAFSVSIGTAVAVNDCRGILYVSPRRSIRGGLQSRDSMQPRERGGFGEETSPGWH